MEFGWVSIDYRLLCGQQAAKRSADWKEETATISLVGVDDREEVAAVPVKLPFG